MLGLLSVTQDIVDQPWYGMFYSAAEVNLYLAELKLIGADLLVQLLITLKMVLNYQLKLTTSWLT